jgi:type II secretory ATPase GspE/PulE/Tfp pilus assembly ATPase PilB-like protein/ActR/RegA family two-component response regulator
MDQDLDVEDAQSPPVVRLCNRIISDAIREDASDIHIEPGQYGFDVRYRIDGVMHTALEVPRRLQPYVLSRLKLIAGMDIAERRRPQDGRLRVRVDKEFVDMRVSSVPTSFGEKIVLRILRNNVSDLTFASLGLQPDTEQRILNTLNQRGRMLLVTGPTGSGKTTMLYTCLSYLRDGTTNIETVEDPIEYRVSGVNQIQVNESAGVTFASALRSILRQDPDVIMIGEIRDSETAEIALQAAQTGHMVLSTLHTNDAPSTITRMLSLEVEPYQLSTSLSGVLAQRLVRKLCDSCKEPLSLHKPEKYTDFLDQLELSADDIYTSIGCEVCRFRGYQGRTGVYSYLEITDPIAELISSGAGTNAIVEQALTSGFRHLSDNATDLVRSGVTSFEEIRGLLRLTVAQTDTAATTVVAVAPQEHSTPLAQAAANVVESPDPAAALQKPKILLVEDDEDIRSILTMMLEREMFEVIQAHNGQDGLTKLYEHSPTLVLCDLMMPVMDGREFIKRMQDNDQTRKIPIVVLTAIDEEKNEIELLDIGATDFVSKATNSNVLLTRIRRALRQAT